MQKSRELTEVQRGTADGWYSPYAQTMLLPWDQVKYDGWKDLDAKRIYGISTATSFRSVPAYLGTQLFSSSERKRPLFNNCLNRKVEAVELPVTSLVKKDVAWPPGGSYTGTYFFRYGISSVYGAYQADADPAQPDWNDTDGAARRAWWSMQPRFEGEFSALNFIYELKDFKDIARHISRIKFSDVTANLSAIKRKLNYARKRLLQGSAPKAVLKVANAATKTVAEVHLAKVFAVDPTVRDLMTLHGQLVMLLNDVQHDFFERGKNIQASHYSETLSESSTLTVVNPVSHYWQHKGRDAKVVFTATMQYRYQYQLRSAFEALKRYYGLNLNAGVVWNALPFTFVVDYFLKVGQAIDFMRIDPNVELRLMQYCESLFSSATAGLHVTGGGGASVIVEDAAGDFPSTLVAGYKGTWYTRNVTSPNKGAALPRLTLPSSKQVTNLVALVRAMW